MSFESEFEFVEINISRILTKIVGLKDNDFNIKQFNDKLIINLDLTKFLTGNLVSGGSVLCYDVNGIVESVIKTDSMFKLCHESINCSDNHFKVLMEYRYTGE